MARQWRRWRRRLIPHFRRVGDWRSKLIVIAQLSVAAVAVVGLISMVTLNPFWLLGFTLVQGLLFMGIAFYVIVVIFAQRAMVEEDFEAGHIIFREGEMGQHLYVIKTGKVEILTTAGGVLRRIKELGPSEHFGEMALLGNHPRNATVRTLTPVALMKMARGPFASLYTSLPGVQQHFNAIVKARLEELNQIKEDTVVLAKPLISEDTVILSKPVIPARSANPPGPPLPASFPKSGHFPRPANWPSPPRAGSPVSGSPQNPPTPA